MKNLQIEFKKYFWDCDFQKLDWDLHKDFILNRFLTYGDLSVIKFILDNIPLDELENYLSNHGKDSLSKTNFIFWKKLTGNNELWSN